MPLFGVLCLLTFCLVLFSAALPIGGLVAAGSILAAVAGRGRHFTVPNFYRWYLGYLTIGAVGWASTRYPTVVSRQLLEGCKVALIGIAAFNVLCTQRTVRTFVVGYVVLFALFPLRGALYNYFHGITQYGRIAWNFSFSNPNDLAMTCFLPLGLCAYEIFVESKNWIRWLAWIGVVAIVAVQMLTQSRGAMLGLGAGIAYFAIHSRRRFRTVIVIAVLGAIAVAVTPSGVWNRVAGLSKLTEDVSLVDPEGSASGRATLMQLAWQIALDNWTIGVGLGAYEHENARIAHANLAIGPYERGERDAHSMYLRALAETGFAGGFCLLIYVIAAIAFCRALRLKIPQGTDEHRRAAALLALEASMLSYALGAVVNSAEGTTFFILQFVIPCAIACTGTRRNHTPLPVVGS